MNKIKHILFTFIFSLVICSQVIVSNAASLSDLKAGTYTIKNDVSHENETGMAMARSYLNESMTLEKSNGSWYYTIKFSGLQYMSNHAIYINGSKVSHTVKSKNTSADTIELKFKTSSISPKMKVSMYVSAMGRDVEFGVIPKSSTLKLVKAAEESKSESSTSNSNSTSSNSNKTNSSSSTTSSSSNKTSSTSNITSNGSNKTSNSSESSTKTETKSETVEKEDNEKETDEEEAKEEAKEETEESDKTEEETKEEVVEKTTEEVVSESSDDKSSNKLIFIGAGAIVVIAIIALVLRRNKK